MKGTGTSTGGKIVIGFVSPKTGAVAGFASGDDFVVDQIRATDAYKNGFTIGGKKYSIEIVVKDSQSDPNRASEVATELILQDKADLVVTSSTPEVTNPVATVCEAQKIPCISTVVPWQAWYGGLRGDPTDPAPKDPLTYTSMFFFGGETFAGLFIPMWNRIQNDKVVAAMFPNDDDGNAFRAVWPGIIDSIHYKFVDGGAYQDGATDYSAMISKFKSNKADIFINAPIPPDFNTMWKQAAQQGFKPKLATVAKVLLFPADTVALGDLVNNIATDQWWGPEMPYTSSLSDMTAQQLADAYQEKSGSSGCSRSARRTRCSRWRRRPDRRRRPARPRRGRGGALQGQLHGHVRPDRLHRRAAHQPGRSDQPDDPGIGIVNPVGVQWKPGTNFDWEMVVVDNSLNPDVTHRRRPRGDEPVGCGPWGRSSSSITSPNGSAGSSSPRTSRSASRRATRSGSWARTAPARRACSG